MRIVPLLLAATLAGGHAQAQSLTFAINNLGAETWWPQDISQNKYVTSNIGDPLVRLVSPYVLEPAIASAWSMSADGLSYSFTLRDDVLFHDGSKLSADDVAFTFSAANVEKFVGFSAIKGGNLLGVEISGNTVVMKLKAPVPALIDNYIVRASIWPRAYIERAGADGFNRAPVGAGPFRLAEHVKGQRVKLAAFDKYYGDAPKVKEVTFRIVPEAATRVAMLRTGEADITYSELGPPAGELRKYGFRVQGYGQPAQAVLVFNNLLAADRTPGRFDDKRVREALMLAVDRKAIADAVYFGAAQPAALPVVGMRMPFYDPRFAPLPYDPARAKKLLAEAGQPALQFDFMAGTNNKDLAVLLVSYWQRAGIKANLNLVDPVSLSRAWWQRTVPGDQVLLAGGLANGMASAVYLNSKSQVAMTAGAATDRLFAEGSAILDPAAQQTWMRTKLLPELDALYPIPAVLEYQEGVIGLGPKVKSWDKFDLHGFGLQWLVPAG